jgi:peptidoglycan hydrolase CwlO-like protein
MNEFRTKFHRLQNDLKRLKEELHKYQQAAQKQEERIRDLEAENAGLRNQLRDALERC